VGLNIRTGEVAFNARWAEMRGLCLGEVAAHVDSWASGIHPEDWPRLQRTLSDYLEGRVPHYEAEYRTRTASGDWIWVFDRGKIFARDQDGLPIRMVGTELDITQRKRLANGHRFLADVGTAMTSIVDYEETLAKVVPRPGVPPAPPHGSRSPRSWRAERRWRSRTCSCTPKPNAPSRRATTCWRSCLTICGTPSSIKTIHLDDRSLNQIGESGHPGFVDPAPVVRH
jgi:PAS domain S-box-containing protein